MRANAVGKGCSEVELAYIAGFLDADGAIMACIEKHIGKRFGFRVRVSVKVTQHDREVLDWMREKLQVGIVRANRPARARQTFDLHIRDREHVRQVLLALMPYVRVKRAQAQIALEILDIVVETPEHVIQSAELADALSRFNVRSKNRRRTLWQRSKNISPLTTERSLFGGEREICPE